MTTPQSYIDRFRIVTKRSGVYQRLKTSRLYDAYWSLKNKSRLEDRDREVNFYRTLLAGLPDGGLVFDVGANAGEKTDIFLRLGVRVVAVEPDESNQEVLRRRFHSYRIVPHRVSIVGRAVSDTAGLETMWVDRPGSALNTLSRKWAETLSLDPTRVDRQADSCEFANSKTVATLTLQDLIETHGTPFYIKIDVEGYESKVLSGLRQVVPYLSFEVNLPEFLDEGRRCVRILDDLNCCGRFNYSSSYSAGLALSEWVGQAEISEILQSCGDKSIEVYWKT